MASKSYSSSAPFMGRTDRPSLRVDSKKEKIFVKRETDFVSRERNAGASLADLSEAPGPGYAVAAERHLPHTPVSVQSQNCGHSSRERERERERRSIRALSRENKRRRREVGVEGRAARELHDARGEAWQRHGRGLLALGRLSHAAHVEPLLALLVLVAPPPVDLADVCDSRFVPSYLWVLVSSLRYSATRVQKALEHKPVAFHHTTLHRPRRAVYDTLFVPQLGRWRARRRDAARETAPDSVTAKVCVSPAATTTTASRHAASSPPTSAGMFSSDSFEVARPSLREPHADGVFSLVLEREREREN